MNYSEAYRTHTDPEQVRAIYRYVFANDPSLRSGACGYAMHKVSYQYHPSRHPQPLTRAEFIARKVVRPSSVAGCVSYIIYPNKRDHSSLIENHVAPRSARTCHCDSTIVNQRGGQSGCDMIFNQAE